MCIHILVLELTFQSFNYKQQFPDFTYTNINSLILYIALYLTQHLSHIKHKIRVWSAGLIPLIFISHRNLLSCVCEIHHTPFDVTSLKCESRATICKHCCCITQLSTDPTQSAENSRGEGGRQRQRLQISKHRAKN